MDLQKFADGFLTMTSIISVRRLSDGSYGDIRIVTGNKPYIDLIEHPPFKGVPTLFTNSFVPNYPYEQYLPKLQYNQSRYYSE